MSDEELNLIAFNSIYKYVNSLNDLYGKEHKPLGLYHRLISKTTIAHKKAVLKHVSCFREFCVSNRQGLMEKNHNKFVKFELRYSENVYIDMMEIFNLIQKENQQNSNQITNAIWKHLLTLSAILDPAGRAKELLKETFKNKNLDETNNKSGKEVNFISNIIDKVEKNVDPNASPMEAISNIINSGVINELITSMNNDLQSGEMDLNKLMGTVASMVGTLGDKKNDQENSFSETQAFNMIDTMLGSFMQNMNLNNLENDNTTKPDIVITEEDK